MTYIANMAIGKMADMANVAIAKMAYVAIANIANIAEIDRCMLTHLQCLSDSLTLLDLDLLSFFPFSPTPLSQCRVTSWTGLMDVAAKGMVLKTRRLGLYTPFCLQAAFKNRAHCWGWENSRLPPRWME